MPVPAPNQSLDDFLAICVPEVLDEETAENPDQAVAICISMYDEAQED